MNSLKYFQHRLKPAKPSQTAGEKSDEWLAAYPPPPSVITLIQQNVHTSATPLAPLLLLMILHYRHRGSAKSLRGWGMDNYTSFV